MKRLIFMVLSCGLALAAEAAPAPREEPAGGFRMEGDPKLETVFGDAEQYKRYVDRFLVVHGEMQTTREDFSRSVQAVLASLAAHQQAASGRAVKCPVDAIAVAYARAYHAGQTYHRLGKDLESNYVSIKELDGLGETSGLTPDYRWKVSRALKLYPQVLRDFREMKLAFQNQLGGELAYHGCDAQVLFTKAEELERTGAAAPAAPPEPPRPVEPAKKKKGQEPVAAPVPATTVTFFVDNSSCEGSLKVYLDGALLGEVASRAKAAFRSLVGRHDLCLIPASSPAQCGDAGTLRKTYIHDGWTITLRCD